ncbi:MAG: hypothetical protein LUG16_08740 [Candidatus Gastranaerophilales bacterium]|nr:hypothetical protein [Candidatus Gastranaerophilales bacterium]
MENNLSFKSVIAVSGKKFQIDDLNDKLYNRAQSGNIIMKDVTEHYKNSSSSGTIAKAAQRGDKVEVYITDEDTQKVRNKEKGWNTLGGILSNIESYYSARKMSISSIFNKILKL